MIVEIGHFALILALFVALVQSSVPMIGATRNDRTWMAVCGPAAMAQFGLILIAFLALMYVYITSDFSVKNVASNSNSMKPLIYKISGVWGNHEGSMLLWVLTLALFSAIVAIFGRNLPPSLKARTLSVQSMVLVGFLLFVILTSNPFERLTPAPLDGRGLNPLLQDPGLALHPPILYIGYVGFSITFSFAVAALIEGKVDAAWARWVRPWALLAWLFLTAGIGLGSWWAYYELGWGGWWYWDPVENASFMPWLVGTALLHSSIVVEKRNALKSWTILLAIITFSLSLIGTFLVRSGVLTSVHSFATDPDRGVFILGLLVITIGGSLTLYAWRAPGLQTGGFFKPISREGGLVVNNLFLTTAAATVFLGTLYPLFLEAFGGEKISVGPPYFNSTFIPLMIPLVIALGFGPLLPWKRSDLSGILDRLKMAFFLAMVALAVTGYLTWGKTIFGPLGIGLASWLAASAVIEFAGRIGLGRIRFGDSFKRAFGLPRSAWGMTLAHLGLSITVAGITGAGLWEEENIQILKPGDSTTVSGYEFIFDGARKLRGPNYVAERGIFRVIKGGRPIVTLKPERRRYLVSEQDTTEAAIYTTAMYDLYAVLGEANGEGGWTTRLYYKPLVPWLWMGTLVMVLGGIMSLTDRRLRIGAPSRHRQKVVSGGVPAE